MDEDADSKRIALATNTALRVLQRRKLRKQSDSAKEVSILIVVVHVVFLYLIDNFV